MQAPITSMRGLIVHVFRVAFFLDKEERISRGEYWVGLFLFLSLGLFAFLLFLCSIIFSPYQDHDLGMSLTDIAFSIVTVITMLSAFPILIASINLSIKRLHDINKSARWLLIALMPLFNIYIFIIMFVQQGDNGTNAFGDDTLQYMPSKSISYWLLCSGMFILSACFSFLSFILLIGLTLPEDGGMINESSYVSSDTIAVE